jgi:hypothetical protein
MFSSVPEVCIFNLFNISFYWMISNKGSSKIGFIVDVNSSALMIVRPKSIQTGPGDHD